ncbi:integrase catalytic domain-containing protein [Trichonephila clavipes]|nr:integrase catalytic domain-containing protein [Trichonephila clavipes]
MRECQARGSRLLPLEESSWIKWAPPVSALWISGDGDFPLDERGQDFGKEDEVNCKDIFANHLIVENEEFDFDRVRNLWLLETIGISPDNEVSLSDKEILKSFEQNTVHRNKRYETRLLWKEDSRKLKSNYEIAKRSLFGLSKTFEKNKELYLKYDEIIMEHLRDGIIERVNMNLDKNINSAYFLPHHTVVCEQKGSTNVRIVFDASSRGKGALSLNDCLESGPNLNPDLLKIILRFRLHKIAFCADIQGASLEIEIVEEDRQFLNFFMDKERGA